MSVNDQAAIIAAQAKRITALERAASKPLPTPAAGDGGYSFMQEATPTGTLNGQTWYQTSTGLSFVYYTDGSSNQWVQIAAPVPESTPEAIRYFTASGTVIGAGATVALPFADNAGNNQGTPGIGNPVNGEATVGVPGVYLIGVTLLWNTSFSVNNGIALYRNGNVIQSQFAFGPFARSGATFTFIQKPLDAATTLTLSAFNASSGSLTVTTTEVVVMRAAEVTW